MEGNGSFSHLLEHAERSGADRPAMLRLSCPVVLPVVLPVLRAVGPQEGSRVSLASLAVLVLRLHRRARLGFSAGNMPSDGHREDRRRTRPEGAHEKEEGIARVKEGSNENIKSLF